MRFTFDAGRRLELDELSRITEGIRSRIRGGSWRLTQRPILRRWHRLDFDPEFDQHFLQLFQVDRIREVIEESIRELLAQHDVIVGVAEIGANARQAPADDGLPNPVTLDLREREPINAVAAESPSGPRDWMPNIGVLGHGIDGYDPFLRSEPGTGVSHRPDEGDGTRWSRWHSVSVGLAHETAVASLIAGEGTVGGSAGQVGMLPNAPLTSIVHDPQHGTMQELVDHLEAFLAEEGDGGGIDVLVSAHILATDLTHRPDTLELFAALTEMFFTGRQKRGCPVVLTAGNLEDSTAGLSAFASELTPIISVAGATVTYPMDSSMEPSVESRVGAAREEGALDGTTAGRIMEQVFLAPGRKAYGRWRDSYSQGLCVACWGPDSFGDHGTEVSYDDEGASGDLPQALLSSCRSSVLDGENPTTSYIRGGGAAAANMTVSAPFRELGALTVDLIEESDGLTQLRVGADHGGPDLVRGWREGDRIAWLGDDGLTSTMISTPVDENAARGDAVEVTLKVFDGPRLNGDYRVFADLRRGQAVLDGSSAATALVGGAVARILADSPGLSASALEVLLRDTATSDGGRLVNVGEALRLAGGEEERSYLVIRRAECIRGPTVNSSEGVQVSVQLKRFGPRRSGLSLVRFYIVPLRERFNSERDIPWPEPQAGEHVAGRIVWDTPDGDGGELGEEVHEGAGDFDPHGLLKATVGDVIEFSADEDVVSETVRLPSLSADPSAQDLAVAVELLPYAAPEPLGHSGGHPNRALVLIPRQPSRLPHHDYRAGPTVEVVPRVSVRYVDKPVSRVEIPEPPPYPPHWSDLTVPSHFDLPDHARVVETMHSGEIRTSRITRSGSEWRAPKRVPSCTLGPLEVRRSPGPDGSPGIVAAKIDWAPTSDHASMHVIFGRSGEAIDKLPPRQRAGRTAACRVIRRSPYAFVGLTLRDVYLHGMVRESFVGASGFPQHDFDGIEVAARWLEKLGGGRLVLGSDDPTHSKLAGEFERRGRVEGVDWLPGAPGDKGERRVTAILEAAAGAVGGVILHRVMTTGPVELEHGCDRVVVLAEGAAPLMLVDPEGRAHFGDAGKELYRIVLDGPKGGSWWVESEREGRRVWVLGQPALDVDVSWPTDERPVLTARAALLDVPPVAWALYVWALDERGRRTLRGKVAGGTDDASLSVKVPDPPGAALEVEVLGDWAKGSPFRRTLRGWVG